ncbi:MAG: CRISPR-associated endonuclease Cas2, partial [Patescibacteria group bacterium]
GLIKDSKEIGGWLLTPKGEELILKSKDKFREYKKRKDGKWVMVIFDIPEKKKRKRELLREKMKFLGFKMLQKSIWISPLDVINEINNFIEKNFLRPYVRTFLIEEIKDF